MAGKCKCPPGSPAWVMTFADLMSLLMCFFVLLLSFSSMDVIKYKQVAGSMKDAFGVQRTVKVKDIPKGLSVIAREFSPGTPRPTVKNVVQQETTHDLQPRPQMDSGRNKKGDTGAAKNVYQELAKLKAWADKSLEGEKRAEAMAQVDKIMAMQEGQLSSELKAEAYEERKRAEAAGKEQKTMADADRIRAALSKEILAGSLDVETEGLKILIRIREKASFASGQAELRDDFAPILGGIATILNETEGHIVVAGHTDDIPIKTSRFRSNWELSSARAVTVAHVLQDAAQIPPGRFRVEGYAETHPLVVGDTPETRAQNRRVEIIIEQGNDLEGERMRSEESMGQDKEVVQ